MMLGPAGIFRVTTRFFGWRGRMGVEPTGAGITGARTVLKFAQSSSTGELAVR